VTKELDARASAQAERRVNSQVLDRDGHQQFTSLLPWLRKWVQRKWPSLDADDVIQDVYLKLLKSPPQSEVQNARAFLMTIARSVAIDQIRRAKVRAFCVPLEGDAYDKPCSQPLPDQRVSARQRLDLVLEHLDKLPARQRRVVTLRRVEGLSMRGVADELGLSVSAVEKLLASSMRFLAAAA
jgi:RNA polymerase sigma-70 factor (ECF subfamily)